MDMKDATKVAPHHPGAMLIALLIMVTSSTSLISYFTLVSGIRDLSLEQQMIIDSLSWVDIGLTFFINISVFTAGVWLFLLRRPALFSFLCALGASVAKLIWAAFSGESPAAAFSLERSSGLVIFGLLLAVCIYTWRLNRSGALS